ncbi:MAG: hypothetical protein ACK4N4_08900 [Burkholderiales bacterium]
MIFLLTPLKPEHDDWALSSYREPVQVIAESEIDARTTATLRFAPEGQQFSLDAMWGPWMNPELVACRIIDAPDDRFLTLAARRSTEARTHP